MKNTLLIPAFLSLAAVVGLSGCGSSNSSSVPNSGASASGCTSTTGATGASGATAQNTALSGKYGFTFTGSATETGAEVIVAGSFTADGAGNISGGEEDINITATSGSAAAQTKGVAITGNYQIGSDGRGTLNFTSIGQTYKINLEQTAVPAVHGQLIRFDCGASGSGTFDLQTQSAFSLGALQQGNYVFEFNGADSGNGPFSGVGNVSLSSSTAAGAGDFNDAGTYYQASTNATLTAPDANGHGTAAIVYGSSPVRTYTYGYDIVSATRILLIQTDANAATVGEMDVQSSGLSATSLMGTYTFLLSGDSTVGSVGIVGEFSAAGGSITASDVVENKVGATSAGSLTSGAYTSSDTVQAVTVNGRYVMTATDPSLAVDNFAIYLVSPGKAFFMEIDPTQLLSGQMLTQTGLPFTASSLNGNYGINFSGFDVEGVEGDFLGQFTSLGTTTISAGTLDINYENANPTTFPNNALSVASYAIVNGGTGHGTLTFVADTVTFTFHFYFVSPNEIFVEETDGQFLTTGAALIQPAIP